jgi:sodium-dependent dicarboxylate transporter 2/3/5
MRLLSCYKNLLFLLSGVIIFLFFFYANPFHQQPMPCKVLAVSAMMIFWWISEAMPLPVIALIPLVLFPLMGISKIEETATGYSNPVIFLFMGGFFISLSIEKWNLHKRIALSIVKLTGTSGDKIILGFILSTGFLSMWLSNTATTMMMFPIAASVIHVMKNEAIPEKNFKHFSLTLLLAIAYASNFGGISTLIGTPPNVAFVAFIKDKYNYEVQFIDWMMLCTPLAIVILLLLYLVMVKWLYPNHIKQDDNIKRFISNELRNLGPFNKAELRVLIIFVITALLWITKDLINKLQLIKLDDTIIALFGALLLFIIPSGIKEEDGNEKTVLQWADTKRMEWGILLLFGGGIAMANALEKAGLIKSFGEWMASNAGTNIFLLVFLVTISSVFLSEVMSNIAQVIVLAPVIAGIADALHIHPLLLGIPMTLAASCASMLPMGTPPNAIVFSSGYIRMKDMIQTGFVMNIICSILITLFCWFVLPMVMHVF